MMRRVLLTLSGLITLVTALLVVPAPHAAAASCPDVEVVFARGTAEDGAPMGLTGISFVEAVRSQLPGKTVVGYPVRYPASAKFDNRRAIIDSVLDGVRDAQARITSVARSCPGTDIVVGGYSQGAVVASYTLSGGIQLEPQYQQYSDQVPKPLPSTVAPKIQAAVLFAPPSDRWIRDIGAPPITIGAQYRADTVSYCIPGDVVCDGSPVQQPNALHVLYSVNGDTLDAARYVAARV
ncbi:cutinase family protein [Gordonia sp. NPDC003376]